VHRLRLHLITVSHDQGRVNRPLSFTVIAHGPLFGELFTSFEDVTISEAFFYESGRVFYEFLRLLGLCSEATGLDRLGRDRFGKVFTELLTD